MRKLASIQKVREVLPIDNADLIESVMINNWEVVVKKDEFKIGDLVVYLEIDSFVPTALAPFLTLENHEPRIFNEVLGEKLKSRKIRGIISQGLVLPLSVLDGKLYNLVEDHDVTDILGIQKYEPPVDNSTGTKAHTGRSAGNFPVNIPKTNENRVQNLTRYWDCIKYESDDYEFQITEKLDGMSVTLFYYDGRVGACSRNWEVKNTDESDIWNVLNRYNAAENFALYCNDNPYSNILALQGEFIGTKVQGNKYKLIEQDIRWFSLFDIHSQKYLSHRLVEEVSEYIGMQTVPLLYEGNSLPMDTISDMVTYSEGKSVLNTKQEREGIVVRKVNRYHEVVRSFKVISNRFLLKQKD
jgi:RNA ligase (TIGR02306 family)